MTREEVSQTIRTFILEKFLLGEPPDSLDDSALLVSSGIVTSLSMLELVAFIEETFSCTLDPDDIGVGQMDSIALLVDLVMRAPRSVAASRE